ncbi:hypothetical protein SAMN02745133_02207 [Desulforamulus putei DSM 12395]|uniref:Uncharacterized protein n=1 Tax=Desulforamulus putei DSM 12395 TaxID=1121429 RepID=A0A1M5A7R5_9FIRM|nr:hypothetical protein [Desulforamulus putei]SHF26371.1 hypothetical protein SAMN02745133_02207 [Desulforamulus putei DSM 12395]
MDSIRKLIVKTLHYAMQAGKDLTEQDIMERYNEYVERYGIENANIALQNTLADFKKLAKREEQRLFCLVKAECLRKFGVAPANRRTFWAEIRENPLRFDTPAAREYREKFAR